jgi:hypothetical protein
MSFSSENSNEYALPVPMQNKRRCKELLMYRDSRSVGTSAKEFSVEGTLCVIQWHGVEKHVGKSGIDRILRGPRRMN